MVALAADGRPVAPGITQLQREFAVALEQSDQNVRRAKEQAGGISGATGLQLSTLSFLGSFGNVYAMERSMERTSGQQLEDAWAPLVADLNDCAHVPTNGLQAGGFDAWGTEAESLVARAEKMRVSSQYERLYQYLEANLPANLRRRQAPQGTEREASALEQGGTDVKADSEPAGEDGGPEASSRWRPQGMAMNVGVGLMTATSLVASVAGLWAHHLEVATPM